MADGIVSPEDYQIQQMLAQAAALRKTPAPQGQMVSGIYVAPSKSQQLLPLINNILAGVKENSALDEYKTVQDQRNQQLNQWLASRPQEKTVYGAGDEGPTMTKVEPTDADTAAWASQGLKNPLSRTIAQKALEDNIVNAPIRAEKAADKKELAQLTYQRFKEDRDARKDLQAERLASAYQLAMVRSGDQALSREQRDEHFKMAQDLKERWMNLTQEGQNARNQANIDARLKAAEIKANASAGGKPLSAKQQSDLAASAEGLYRIQNLVDNFKDDYVGAGAATKNLLSPYGTLIPGFKLNDDDVKRINWWKEWESVSGKERHELYGSALTKVENEAWKRQTITDTTPPEVVKATLQRRLELIQRAVKRLPLIQAGGVLNQQTGEVEMPSGKSAPAPRSALPRSTGVGDPPPISTGDIGGTTEARQREISRIKKDLKEKTMDGASRKMLEDEVKRLEQQESTYGSPAPAQKSGGWSIRRVE